MSSFFFFFFSCHKVECMCRWCLWQMKEMSRVIWRRRFCGQNMSKLGNDLPRRSGGRFLGDSATVDFFLITRHDRQLLTKPSPKGYWFCFIRWSRKDEFSRGKEHERHGSRMEAFRQRNTTWWRRNDSVDVYSLA